MSKNENSHCIKIDPVIIIDGWTVTESYSGTQTSQSCFEKTIHNHIISGL